MPGSGIKISPLLWGVGVSGGEFAPLQDVIYEPMNLGVCSTVVTNQVLDPNLEARLVRKVRE